MIGIGVDFGTTNSLAAVFRDGRPRVIGVPEPLLPSVVHISPRREVTVGRRASELRLLDPVRTITGIKRFIGRTYNEVFDLAATVPFKVVPGPDDYVRIRIDGHDWTAEEIAAEILKILKAGVDRETEGEATRVVATIPAYFGHAQAEAVRRAYDLAGFRIERVISEPTAAALCLPEASPQESVSLIADLGGGTYDVSLLEIGDGVAEVIAVDGDGYLGGDDFDQSLLEWILEEVRLSFGDNVGRDPVLQQRIREAVVAAKCDLSGNEVTRLRLPHLFETAEGWQSIEMSLSRSMMEALTQELFARLVPPVQRVVASSWRKPTQVILVGGAALMPRVGGVLSEIVKAKIRRIEQPDQAVARGAAIEAGVLVGDVRDTVLLDVTPHPISIETAGNRATVILEANTTIPTRKSEVFTPARDGQAAVEVNILQGGARMATANRLLGTLVLEGLQWDKEPPLVLITVDVDATGALSVSARNEATGELMKLSTMFR